jgi:hypothetical protein
VFTYTRNTPSEGRQLTPGEILIAFVLYADPLLSINQIAQLFDSVYDIIHTTIRKVEAAFEIGVFVHQFSSLALEPPDGRLELGCLP